VINTQLEISFDFRTVQWTGVIISTSNTYSGVAIQMYEGKVSVSTEHHHLFSVAAAFVLAQKNFCLIFTPPDIEYRAYRPYFAIKRLPA